MLRFRQRRNFLKSPLFSGVRRFWLLFFFSQFRHPNFFLPFTYPLHRPYVNCPAQRLNSFAAPQTAFAAKLLYAQIRIDTTVAFNRLISKGVHALACDNAICSAICKKKPSSAAEEMEILLKNNKLQFWQTICL